jgi:pimeloyl-ACP methyl ester carboxylesterase
MDNWKQENVTVNSQHGNKRAFTYDIRYLSNDTKKPLLLFVHGFKGFKDWGVFNLMADDFARAGFVFAKCNLSHNGTTPQNPNNFADLEAFGHNNFSIELDDLSVVLDSILGNDKNWANEINYKQIALIGHSRGGSLVLLKANEDSRIRAVASLAAVADLSTRYPQSVLDQWQEQGVLYIDNSRTGQRMPMYYQFVENYKENQERFSVEQAVKGRAIPTLFVHGSADSSVAVQDLYDLKSWKPTAETLEVPGADHTFGATHPWQENSLPGDFEKVVSKLKSFFSQAFTS